MRLLPALVPFPPVRALAQRFDRPRAMVVGDVLRAALLASIPLAGMVFDPAPAVTWALVATFLIGTIGMSRPPATAVPDRITMYRVAPVLAALLLAGLSRAMLLTVGDEPGRLPISPVDVALYVTALVFLVAAVLAWTVPGIGRPGARPSAAPGSLPGSLPGLPAAATDPRRPGPDTPAVRGVVPGIVAVSAAVGVVVGVAPFYAESLGGGDASFALLVAALLLGLGAGTRLGPTVVRTLSRPRWYALSIVLAGGAVTVLALAPHLAVAVPVAALVGAGAGMAIRAGSMLSGAELPRAEPSGAEPPRAEPSGTVPPATELSAAELLGTMLSGAARGRTSVRATAWVVLIVAVLPASVLGGMRLGVVDASRVLLLLAGLTAIGAGIVAFRRLDDRPGVPVLPDLLGALRGRPLGHPDEERYPGGLFVVFEGGEGAGKSTQAVKLAAWLRVEGGRECVLTREPGATPVGARIRGILLDKSSEGLAPRAEALLYAADRAHHVASVIRPALSRGEVVISDRYVDSSLAYQGAGRALRADEVAWLSSWATGGLVPDLVVLLDVDPAVGLGRVSERGEADRLEAEAVTFHRRVRASFLDLAARDPQRYLVLDAAGDPDAIAGEVRRRVTGLLGASAPEGVPTPAAGCVPTEPAATAEPAPTATATPAEQAAASAVPAAVTDPAPIEWAATA
ncbi:MAG: thymidylate kinase, partial [Mycobacterium sp.]|nr:thymidylate kinase [Mycobacterium sp.]